MVDLAAILVSASFSNRLINRWRFVAIAVQYQADLRIAVTVNLTGTATVSCCA
jgi:hypothetical protein